MTHEQLIAQCFQWHWNTFIEERQMLYGVNNNSYDEREGNRNKAKGVVAGVLDFCYITPRGPSIYLDAKVGSDTLSKAQLSFIAKCEARGVECFEFSTLKEFQTIILMYHE
jgi:hypothetical protein